MHYISDNTWPVLAVTQDNIQVRTSDYAFGRIKPEQTTSNRSGHRKNLYVDGDVILFVDGDDQLVHIKYFQTILSQKLLICICVRT